MSPPMNVELGSYGCHSDARTSPRASDGRRGRPDAEAVRLARLRAARALFLFGVHVRP
jgi:hypothetical protein